MSRPRWARPLLTLTLVFSLGATRAWAGAPTDAMRDFFGAVNVVLTDPRTEDQPLERLRAIRRHVDDVFDFREAAMLALGREWTARTHVEQNEFVALFADLLERSYIGKIELYSGGEKIQYTGELMEGSLATVRTRIVTKSGAEVPVDYRMHRVDERWVVYDVAIEGVSLVANYRAQFNKLIQTSSFRGLVDKLRAKRDEALQADGATGTRASQK
jgi:phospholipid transport system substrate-binding protein